MVHRQTRVLQAACFRLNAKLTAGLANYIRFYNHARRHTALGMISPIDFELAEQASQQSS
ncbi:IS3 family transposase [Gordonia rubripertincta]|uniref:IS3 family transposase n=1 Tax=Gordonia rubripertincta TaxID=36822 RepID=UPI003464D067